MSEILNQPGIKTDQRNRWKFSLPACVTFVLALGMTTTMAILGHVYGWHSTPGILISLANCPGAIVGVWASMLVAEGPGFYVLSGLVNWAFYFYVIKGMMLLIRKFKT